MPHHECNHYEHRGQPNLTSVVEVKEMGWAGCVGAVVPAAARGRALSIRAGTAACKPPLVPPCFGSHAFDSVGITRRVWRASSPASQAGTVARRHRIPAPSLSGDGSSPRFRSVQTVRCETLSNLARSRTLSSSGWTSDRLDMETPFAVRCDVYFRTIHLVARQTRDFLARKAMICKEMQQFLPNRIYFFVHHIGNKRRSWFPRS